MSYKFKQTMINPNFPNVIDVAPNDVLENATALKLIDVRETSEYVGELGHIENSELIVLNTIPEKIDSLPKDQTIVFICRSGGRSAQATAFAISKGFSNVYNMRGGMLAWNNQLLPIRK
jgi:rhodanese-related sulfurtransferase